MPLQNAAAVNLRAIPIRRLAGSPDLFSPVTT
jgi:hypothetical protein